MNEKFVTQLIAELIESQSQAMAMLTMALAQGQDAGALKARIEALIKAGKATKSILPTAEKFLLACQAAAHAEALHQASVQGEAGHPKPH